MTSCCGATTASTSSKGFSFTPSDSKILHTPGLYVVVVLQSPFGSIEAVDGIA